MPRGMNAPKLWPAEPVNVILIVSSGSPAAPYRLVTSEPSIVPTVRSALRMNAVISTGVPCSSAGRLFAIRSLSSATSRP